MATCFCFSDECGDYNLGMTSRQLARHPYYIRSTLLIDSNEWKKLSSSFKNLKEKYGIPLFAPAVPPKGRWAIVR